MFAHSHGDAMYWTAGFALLVMAVTYVAIMLLANRFNQKIPLAITLFVAVAASAVATGFNPLRHLFEGPVWYIYINLVILCGMIFLTTMKAAGNLDCIAHDILANFRTRPAIGLVLVMVLLFFPGMAIFLTVLAFVFIGDGLRDALDPKLK